jgi:hypothetical protein
MKKSLLFLSAAITIFILVILANVLLKVRASVLASSVSTPVPTDTAAPVATIAPVDTATQVDTQTLLPTNTAVVSPTVSPFISAQEAVFIAASALGNTKVYSVDTATRYGMDVYQVNFSSGAIVFVSPQGHILTITSLQSNAAAPTAIQSQQTSSNKSQASSSSNQNHDDSGGDD